MANTDNAPGGIAAASPVVLNVGTIKDAFGNNAALTFSTVNAPGVIVDTTAPKAAITYSPNTAVNAGTSLVITATFTEAMAGSPVVEIAISGVNALSATNMTNVDSTHYTYTYIVGTGNGTDTVALSVGTDPAGNLITSAPTSGATFTVDNTAPGVPGTPNLTAASDTGSSTSDNITRINTPTFTVSATVQTP